MVTELGQQLIVVADVVEQRIGHHHVLGAEHLGRQRRIALDFLQLFQAEGEIFGRVRHQGHVHMQGLQLLHRLLGEDVGARQLQQHVTQAHAGFAAHPAALGNGLNQGVGLGEAQASLHRRAARLLQGLAHLAHVHAAVVHAGRHDVGVFVHLPGRFNRIAQVSAELQQRRAQGLRGSHRVVLHQLAQHHHVGAHRAQGLAVAGHVRPQPVDEAVVHAHGVGRFTPENLGLLAGSQAQRLQLLAVDARNRLQLAHARVEAPARGNGRIQLLAHRLNGLAHLVVGKRLARHAASGAHQARNLAGSRSGNP